MGIRELFRPRNKTIQFRKEGMNNTDYERARKSNTPLGKAIRQYEKKGYYTVGNKGEFKKESITDTFLRKRFSNPFFGKNTAASGK